MDRRSRLPLVITVPSLTIIVPAPLLVLRQAGIEVVGEGPAIGASLTLEPRCERRRRRGAGMIHGEKAAIATQRVRSMWGDPGVHTHFVSLEGGATTTAVVGATVMFRFNRGVAKQPPITFLSQWEAQ